MEAEWHNPILENYECSPEILNRPVRKLSLGQRMRADLGMALLHEPEILFLDEPTLGLDPQTREHVWEYILELQRAHEITVFMTTHYMEEAEHCDRIAIIDEGRIVATGTPEELKALEETGTHMAEITEFVPVESIDPVYFDKAYYLAPDKGGAKPYALLARALRGSGRCAAGRGAARARSAVGARSFQVCASAARGARSASARVTRSRIPISAQYRPLHGRGRGPSASGP